MAFFLPASIPWLLLSLVTCVSARVSIDTIGGLYNLFDVPGIVRMPFCTPQMQVPRSADGRISAESLQASCIFGTWEFKLSTNLTGITNDTASLGNSAGSFSPNTINCDQYTVSAFHIYPATNATVWNVDLVGGFRYIFLMALSDPEGVCIYQGDDSEENPRPRLPIKETPRTPEQPPKIEPELNPPESDLAAENRVKTNRQLYWRWLGPFLGALVLLLILAILMYYWQRRRKDPNENDIPGTPAAAQYDDVYIPVAEDTGSVASTGSPTITPSQSVSTTQYPQVGGDGEVQQFSGFPPSAPTVP